MFKLTLVLFCWYCRCFYVHR